MRTRIFLDSGNPGETTKLIEELGFLDGQTTNPTLISKNPHAKARFERGEKFTKEEIYSFYKDVIRELSQMMPKGSISIEVYSDADTTAVEMIEQAEEMYSWIPNAHIKLPTTKAGLTAAEALSQKCMRLNMTLVFSQAQAAAVYAATHGAKKGDVYVSPFVGRLDDLGENGMGLIKNIIEMYKAGDGHVAVLTASVRNIEHFLYALSLGSDIITAGYPVLHEWGERGKPTPDRHIYIAHNLKPIAYENLNLDEEWHEFEIHHELTDKGVERFSADWNALII